MEIVCIAQFKAIKNKKSDLIGALEQLVSPTKNEPGCLQYELCSELEYNVPSDEMWDICLVEKWRSLEDFHLHCDSTYIKEFFDVTARQCVEKSSVRLFRPQ